MLYRIKENSKLDEINKKNILEKDLQKVIEENLEELFSLQFVETEVSIENVRFDTFALDKENNSPVIIEYKRSFEKSLFDQGMEYLNILFSRKADFVIKLHKKLGIAADMSTINWSNARIIFVAEKYSDRQKRAISFNGLPIELWTFEWFSNDYFRLDPVLLNKEAGILDLSKSISDEFSPISKIKREIKEYSRESHLENKSQLIVELFEKLENSILELGDIREICRQQYIGFYNNNGRSLAATKILKSKIQVEFGKERDSEIFMKYDKVIDISKNKWAHSFMIEINNEDDIDQVLLILKKALTII